MRVCVDGRHVQRVESTGETGSTPPLCPTTLSLRNIMLLCRHFISFVLFPLLPLDVQGVMGRTCCKREGVCVVMREEGGSTAAKRKKMDNSNRASEPETAAWLPLRTPAHLSAATPRGYPVRVLRVGCTRRVAVSSQHLGSPHAGINPRVLRSPRFGQASSEERQRCPTTTPR